MLAGHLRCTSPHMNPFAEEDAKRKQLKKAGEDYFASVLEKAGKVSSLPRSIALTPRPFPQYQAA